MIQAPLADFCSNASYHVPRWAHHSHLMACVRLLERAGARAATLLHLLQLANFPLLAKVSYKVIPRDLPLPYAFSHSSFFPIQPL